MQTSIKEINYAARENPRAVADLFSSPLFLRETIQKNRTQRFRNSGNHSFSRFVREDAMNSVEIKGGRNAKGAVQLSSEEIDAVSGGADVNVTVNINILANINTIAVVNLSIIATAAVAVQLGVAVVIAVFGDGSGGSGSGGTGGSGSGGSGRPNYS